jgi:DNA processing protein
MESIVDREAAFCILNALPRLGIITLKKLLAEFGNDPLNILNASPGHLRQISGLSEHLVDVLQRWEQHFPYVREAQNLKRMGAEFISFENERYPPLLKTIYDPPIGLYCHGPVRADANTVAIVGTRRPTLYGIQMAERLAVGLAERGFCVASGFARGIDTAVHQSVLGGGGKTLAVLGSGVDHIYPPENAELYNQLREKGGMISEFRLGQRADRSHFPRRNRILSGISQAVIVVESDSEGGSMITAEFALEHNRQVFAVPGRVDVETSRGCHTLIRNGATLVRSAEDVLEDLYGSRQIQFNLELDSQIRAVSQRPELETLPEGPEKMVFECIRHRGPLYPDQILQELNIPSGDLQIVLFQLEIKGYVIKRISGSFEAK